MVRKVLSGGEALAAKLAEIAQKVSSGATVSAGFLQPDLATIAFFNEFGTTQNGAQHIPPRPAVRNAIAENAPDWCLVLADRLAATGMDVEASLRATGEAMRSDIQLSIRDFSDPPNAASTIRQKGFDNPLVGRTKDLLNGVDFEVSDDESA